MEQIFELKGKFLALTQEWKRDVYDARKREMHKILKEHFGSSAAIFDRNLFGDGGVVAVKATKDLEHLKPHSKYPEYFVPNKKTKKGKELASMLSGIKMVVSDNPVFEILDLTYKLFEIENSRVSAPQIFQVDDRWFISVPAKKVPDEWLENVELVPITNIHYVQLCKQRKEED